MKVTKAAKWDIQYHNRDDMYQIDKIVKDKMIDGIKHYFIK